MESLLKFYFIMRIPKFIVQAAFRQYKYVSFVKYKNKKYVV